MQTLWWHWIVLGIVLMLLELAVPSFFLVWFGLGAVIVSLTLVFFPGAPFAFLILGWTASSLLSIALWFKVFRTNIFNSRVGMARGSPIDEVGLVTRDIRPHERGQVRFQKPMLGDEVWESVANEEIRAGERVRVQEVEGNTLRVRRAL